MSGPRVTPADIEALISEEYFFTAANAMKGTPGETSVSLQCLTICVLVLRNGFTVTGESACAAPENFNADVGKRLAREKAVEKVWPLEGYRLKQRLYEEAQSVPQPA